MLAVILLGVTISNVEFTDFVSFVALASTSDPKKESWNYFTSSIFDFASFFALENVEDPKKESYMNFNYSSFSSFILVSYLLILIRRSFPKKESYINFSS